MDSPRSSRKSSYDSEEPERQKGFENKIMKVLRNENFSKINRRSDSVDSLSDNDFKESFFKNLFVFPDLEDLESDIIEDEFEEMASEEESSIYYEKEEVESTENVSESIESSDRLEEGYDIPFDDFDKRWPKDKKFRRGLQDDTEAIAFLENIKLKRTTTKIPEMTKSEETLKPDRIVEDVDAFWNQMIAFVVGHGEQALSFKTMDKLKLFYELKFLALELERETRVNAFVNLKAVQHFRRKKERHSLVDFDMERNLEYMMKFKEANAHLNKVLSDEKCIAEKTKSKIESLTKIADSAEKQAKNEISILEKFIMKSLKSETRPKLEIAAAKELSEMNSLRCDISKVRSTLILKQHTDVELLAKLEKVENIGGSGLRLEDYLKLQQETQALEKKAEEKNLEMNRRRSRYHSIVQYMGHSQKMKKIKTDFLQRTSTNLVYLEQEKHIIHRNIVEMKKSHLKIRRHINELARQSGLLSKPHLMMDYDNTVERVSSVGENIRKLREEKDQLERKLKKLQKSCMKRNNNLDNTTSESSLE